MKLFFVGVFTTEVAPHQIEIDCFADWFSSQHEAAGAMLEKVRERHPKGQIMSHRVDDITNIAKRGVRLGSYA